MTTLPPSPGDGALERPLLRNPPNRPIQNPTVGLEALGMERETRLELATSTLARLRSTN